MTSRSITQTRVIQDTESFLLNASVVCPGVCGLYCVKDSALNIACKTLVISQVDVVQRSPNIRLNAERARRSRALHEGLMGVSGGGEVREAEHELRTSVAAGTNSDGGNGSGGVVG